MTRDFWFHELVVEDAGDGFFEEPAGGSAFCRGRALPFSPSERLRASEHRFC